MDTHTHTHIYIEREKERETIFRTSILLYQNPPLRRPPLSAKKKWPYKRGGALLRGII
jgi:hypothetical protein